GKLYPYANFAPGAGPGQPANLAPYAMTRALNRYENYMVDTGIPKHHIQFNGIYDLPFGTGKRLLGNANRWENEIIGGFQIAGSGSVISQDLAVGSGNWGPTNPIHIYNIPHRSRTAAAAPASRRSSGSTVTLPQRPSPALTAQRNASAGSRATTYPTRPRLTIRPVRRTTAATAIT